MKKLTLEATDENVLNSIKDDMFNRRDAIRDFIQALDMIEGNAFISLDARWGEGKTFYVRQIEKTLEYIVKKTWGEPGVADDLKPYFENSVLDSITLEESYLPIYYNAWLYDNHNDPLLSLLFVIVKKCKKYLDTKLDSGTVGEKIFSLLPSISKTIKKVDLSVEPKQVVEAFNGKDILNKIKTAEEIREKVKEILDAVIVGDAQKLVIFVDELDRCKPSFAIEMLERIKHYFDDERIIFIASINKEQLVHTISKYYGVGFDSTGYLNKFFDLNVYMPQIKRSKLFESHSSEQYCVAMIVESLNEYYKLTLRDGLIFKNRMSDMPRQYVNDFSAQGCCLSIFIPIITILDILDVKEKIKFLEGKSDALKNLSEDIPQIHRIISRFGSRDVAEEKQYTEGFEKIKEVYDYAFGNKETYPKLDVNSNIKELCIKICNKF